MSVPTETDTPIPEPVEFPEHEKMKAVAQQSQAIGEFLETTCYALCEDSGGDRYYPVMKNIEQLLAEHFDIDLAKIEDEKRTMLARLTGDETWGEGRG